MKVIKILVIFIFLITSSDPATSQNLSLTGTLVKHDRFSNRLFPAVGYRVFLYNQKFGWIGPAITDVYGRYAFYNMVNGSYLMRIFNPGIPNAVWQGMVNVPGQVIRIRLP